MSKPGRIASMLLMASLLSVTVLARADAALQIQPLVPFASTEGLERLTRSTAKSDFAPLANQFEAQATIAFCGPTTAAIVLNTLRPSAIETPRDRSRLRPEDERYLPKSLELTVPRHTQESVIATGKKSAPKSSASPRPSMARSCATAATSYANLTSYSRPTASSPAWSSSMRRPPKPISAAI